MKRILVLLAMCFAFMGTAFADVNINTATVEQLDSLKGIGPVKAKAIVDYRAKNGPFKALDDLKKVDGIGDATFDSLKGQIKLTGTTRVAAPGKADEKAAPAKAADKSAPPPAARTGAGTGAAAAPAMSKGETKASDAPKSAKGEAKAEAPKAAKGDTKGEAPKAAKADGKTAAKGDEKAAAKSDAPK
jgi:competence protein ComEA